MSTVRWAIVVVLIVGCTKARTGGASDPVIDDFRAVERACRAKLASLQRQADEHVRSDEGVTDQIFADVIEPWRALRARVDAATPPEAQRELYDLLRRYLGEREAAWLAYYRTVWARFERIVASDPAPLNAVADATAQVLDAELRKLGFSPLPPLAVDAGVTLASPAQAEPGAAFLLVGDRVVLVDATGFREIAKQVNTLSVGADGTMWACGVWNVVRWEGTSAFATRPNKPVTTCAAGPDGRLWTFHDTSYDRGADELASFDGTSWQVVTAPVGSADEDVSDLVVDRDGVLYARNDSSGGGGAGLWSYDGATWSRLTLPGSTESEWLGRLFLGGDGRAWSFYQVHHGDGYPLALAALTPSTALPPSFVDVRAQVAWLYASIDANGAATVLDAEDNSIVQGQTRLVLPRVLTWGGSDGGAGPFAYDAAGRLWVELDDGLSVIARDGHRVVFPRGSVAALDQPIRQISVVGAGPALPPPAPVVSHTVTGVAIERGKPLASTPVRICMAERSSDPPCAYATFVRDTTTDADGRFTFPDVPRWQQLTIYRHEHVSDPDAGVTERWLSARASCCRDADDLGQVVFGQ